MKNFYTLLFFLFLHFISIAQCPGIRSQPRNQFPCDGDVGVQFSFTTEPPQSNITPQWQISMDGGNNYGNIPPNHPIYTGAQSRTLTVNTIEQFMEGYLFRCMYTSPECNGNQYTDAAVLGINFYVTQQPQNRSICAGDDTNFTLEAEGPGGFLSYQWQILSGTNWIDVQDNDTYSGSQTKILTITDAPASLNNSNYRCTMFSVSCGMEWSNEVTLTINSSAATPEGIAALYPIPNCRGNSNDFEIIGHNNNNNLIYTWSYAPSSGVTIAPIPEQPNNTFVKRITFGNTAMPGNISVTARNASGCTTQSAPTTLAIYPIPPEGPPSTISGPSPVCQGTTHNYSINPVTGATSYTWGYTGGNGVTITGTGINVPVNFSSTATSGTLNVRANNACGFTDRTRPIAVATTPGQPGIISGPSTICQGQSNVSYSVPAVTGATGYTWSYVGGQGVTINGTGNSRTLTFAANATNGTLSIRATNGPCSSVARTLNITVATTPGVPAIQSSGPAIPCGGDVSLSIQGSVPSGGQVRWYRNGDATHIGTGTPFIVTQPGIYTARFVVASCTSAVSNTLNLAQSGGPAAPTLSSPTTTIPCGGSIMLTAGNVANGGTVSWYRNGNTIPGGSGTQFMATLAGDYTATVTVNNCVSSSSAPVVLTQSGGPDAPTITSPTTTIPCNGGVMLSIESSVPSGAIITWYRDRVEVSEGTSTTYNAMVAGNYRASITVNDCSSNPSDPPITLTQATAPQAPTISSPTTTIPCNGSVTLSVQSEVPPGATVTWYQDRVEVGTGTTFSATTEGIYNAEITLNGCGSGISNAINLSQAATPAAPTISATATTIPCGGNVTLTAENVANGGTVNWYRDGIAIDGGSGIQFIATLAGNYTATVTANSCVSSPSMAIILTQSGGPGVPSISAGGPTTFCEGGSVVLTATNIANGGTITWFSGSTQVGIGTNYTATASGSYTATVTVNGCTSASSTAIMVTENAIPGVPSISAGGPTTFCEEGSVVLTATNVANGGTITWFNGSTQVGTGTNYTATASGSYTATVTVNGCTSTSSTAIVITENIVPAATISADGPTTFPCSGGNVTLTATDIATDGTVSWFNGSTQVATGMSYIATQAGDYTALVTVDDCTSSASNNIRVTTIGTPEPPTISAGGPTTFPCSGGSVTLTAENVATGGTVSWFNGSTQVATGMSYIATQAGDYTALVTVDDCTSSASNNIRVTTTGVPSAPSISVDGPTTFPCSGGSVTLTAENVATGGTVSWFNGSTQVATGMSYIATQAGDYTALVTVDDCTSSASNNIRVTTTGVPSAPSISAEGPTTFCEGGSVVLTATDIAPGGTVTWFNGSTQVGTGMTYTAAEAGIYTAIVTVDGCNSAASNDITVVVNSLPPVPTISGPEGFCTGSSITLTSTASSGNQWYIGSTLISEAVNPTLTVTQGGNYKVRVTNSNNCFAESAVFTVVEATPPATPTITVSGPTTICAGGSVVLGSSTTPAGGSYQWYRNNEPIATNEGGTVQDFTVTTAGTYRVEVSNTYCSTSSADVTVTVIAVPSINNHPASISVCAGSNATFSVTAGGNGTLNYQWQVNSGNGFVNIQGANSSSLTVNNVTTGMSGHQYRVIVSISGCDVTSNAATLMVHIVPTVVLSASPYTRLFPGLITSINANINPTGGTYRWFRDGILIPGFSGSAMSVSVNGLGDYRLEVTSVNGCISSSNILTISDSSSNRLFVYPNPNNGEFQARFHSTASNSVARSLTIYNGQGMRVFSKLYTNSEAYSRMDVDIRQLGKGTYWVEVNDNNGKRLAMSRVIVQ